MSQYIDGFVHAIPRDSLDAYRKLVEPIAEIWKELGALDYKEFSGDDMHLEGTLSFVDLFDATENEVIMFGWVEFESSESRRIVNEKVATDPRMAELMGAPDAGFDASRMAYGGFLPFVPSSS